MRARRCCLLAAALVAAMLGQARTASADPQWNVSIISGAAGEGTHDDLWQRTRWFNALHGDVILGRDQESAMGVGPYLELGTSGFDDLRLGGGGSAVLPITDHIPLVLSGGAYGRDDGSGFEPGLAGAIYFGARSYNFHGSYGVTAGLNLGLTYGLGDSHEATVILAAQFDSSAIWLPMVILYNWIRGPGED